VAATACPNLEDQVQLLTLLGTTTFYLVSWAHGRRRPMRFLFTLALLFGVAACQVTTSQSMGGGVTVRSSHPIENDQASDEPAADEHDEEAPEDRAPDVTIGGGFGTGVSR
jgi:hypothetical protein